MIKTAFVNQDKSGFYFMFSSSHRGLFKDFESATNSMSVTNLFPASIRWTAFLSMSSPTS